MTPPTEGDGFRYPLWFYRLRARRHHRAQANADLRRWCKERDHAIWHPLDPQSWSHHHTEVEP